MLTIFLTGLALRLAVFAYIVHIPGKFFTFDSSEYDLRALNLLHDHVFSGQLHAPFTADLLRTPLYPLLLAAVYAIAGHVLAIAVLVQIVLGSLTGVLTFVLASSELKLTSRAAGLAGLAVAADPVSIMTSNQVLTETLFVLLLVVALILLARYWRTRAVRWAVAAAVVLAVDALVRPIGQYLPLALLPLFPALAGRGRRRGTLAVGLLFVVVSGSLIGAWAYRNYRAAGVFTVSNISDTNLIYYRAREVLADAHHISQDAAWAQLQSYIDTTSARRHLTLAQTFDLERSTAFAIFKQYPRLTALMTLKGAARMLADPGYSIACTLLDPRHTAYHCIEGSQANMDEPGALHRAVIGFKSMSKIQQGALVWSALLLMLVYTCAIAGTIRCARRRRWLAPALLLVAVAYFVAVSSGGETTSRFRIAIWPLVTILAGVGADAVLARVSVRAPSPTAVRLRQIVPVGEMPDW